MNEVSNYTEEHSTMNGETHLPIDINIINQRGQGARQDAITADFDLELFSPNADEVNELMESQFIQSRQNLNESFFQAPNEGEVLAMDEIIQSRSEDVALFQEPWTLSRSHNPIPQEASIPWGWVTVGLVFAGILAAFCTKIFWDRKQEKEEEKQNVHYYDL